MTRATWPIPIAIAVLSIVGLVAALTGDGWRDALSWAALGVPLGATGCAMRRRRAARPSQIRMGIRT